MRISVDTKSIDRALKKLQRYQSTFETNVRKVMKRMTEEGMTILNARIAYADPNEVDTNVKASSEVIALENGNYQAKLQMTGNDVAFIEFGSGVIHNTAVGGSVHPKGQELGMTIGSYPNQTHADDPKGWWHDGRHYRGSSTVMPLYSTAEELSEKVTSIAREVFNEIK